MKVKMYIDLSDEYYHDVDNVIATTKPGRKWDGATRYAFEVEIPDKHFKPEPEDVTLGDVKDVKEQE